VRIGPPVRVRAQLLDATFTKWKGCLLNLAPVYVERTWAQVALALRRLLSQNSDVADDREHSRQAFNDETLAAFDALRRRAREAAAEATRERTAAAEQVRALAQELEFAARELDGLHTAMQTRATIEQAKGVLMGLHGCTADQAFERLAQLSQAAQRKLHDVAASIVADVSRGQAGVRSVVDLTSQVAPDVGSGH
jgi:hypothetical protein